MRGLFPAMEVIVQRSDPVAWIAVDWTFHETLYRAAHRPRLLRTIRNLREEARRYRKVGLALPDVLAVSLKEHKAIVEACVRRDGEEVESLIRTALERTRCELRQVLEHDLATKDGVFDTRGMSSSRST